MNLSTLESTDLELVDEAVENMAQCLAEDNPEEASVHEAIAASEIGISVLAFRQVLTANIMEYGRVPSFAERARKQ